MITMPQPPSAVSWLAGIAAVMLSACSGAPTPAPSKTPTAAPSPSSTPLPPDTQTVAVVEIGIGTFDLAAFPVASLKNEAMYHAAASVVVHFVTHRADRTLGSLELGACQPRAGRGPGRDCGLHRRLHRGSERERERRRRLLDDQRRTGLPHRVRHLCVPAMPLRTRLWRCQRDHHTLFDDLSRRRGGGLRGLQERRRGHRRWGLGAIHLAGGSRPCRRRPRRAERRTVLLCPRSVHRLVTKRSIRLVWLQAQLPGVVGSAGLRSPRCRRDETSPEGQQGVEPLSKPGQGRETGARPNRSNPPCIYPSGHVDWFSVASCW